MTKEEIRIKALELAVEYYKNHPKNGDSIIGLAEQFEKYINYDGR